MSRAAGARWEDSWDRFVEHLQESPGRLTVERRRALFDQGRAAGVDDSELGDFCTLVAERSYRVTADDVEALERSGYSEDQIFEAIVLAAVGAAQRRLDAARAAIAGG
jgi:hypothetical protein